MRVHRMSNHPVLVPMGYHSSWLGWPWQTRYHLTRSLAGDRRCYGRARSPWQEWIEILLFKALMHCYKIRSYYSVKLGSLSKFINVVWLGYFIVNSISYGLLYNASVPYIITGGSSYLRTVMHVWYDYG